MTAFMRIAAASLLLFGLGAGVSAAPGGNGDGPERPTVSELREAVDRVFTGDDYQTEIDDGRARGRSLDVGGPVLPDWVGDVVVWTVLVVFSAVLLLAIAWGLFRTAGLFRKGGDAGAAAGPSLGVGPVAKAREALGEAEILASGEKYLDAVRTLFMEAAARIETSRKIALAPADTNLEYLSRFPGDWNVRFVMERLASLIDRCFYGGHECTEEDWLASREAWTRAMEIEA